MIKIIFLFLIILLAQSIETTTGFGATVIAVGLGAYFMELKELIVVLVLIGWLQSLFIVARAFSWINWRALGSRILPFAGLGMPVGIWFYRHFGTGQLKMMLAVFIIFSASLQLVLLLIRKKELPPLSLFWSVLLLFSGGFIHGIFATGGPLIVIYASRALKEKSEFRATLSLLWLLLNSALLINFFLSNQLTKSAFQTAGMLLPGLILGILFGEFLHHRVNQFLFNISVQSLLLLTGIFLFFR